MKLLVSIISVFCYLSCWSINIPVPLNIFNYDLEFVFNYTRHLQRRHQFKTIVIFNFNCAKDSAPMNIIRNSLEKAIMQEFEMPLFVRCITSVIPLRKYLGLNNFVIVFIANLNDPILEAVNQSLDGLHLMHILVLYRQTNTGNINNESPSLAEIQEFFNWCWSYNSVNVALAFKVFQKFNKSGLIMVKKIREEVFSYLPYPKMQLVNLTGIAMQPKGIDFFTKDFKDLQGYVFKTPIFQNPPAVFMTPHERHHKFDYRLFITGTSGRLYHEFAHYVNASIELNIRTNVSFYSYHEQTLLMAAHKLIDIGIHPYSDLLPYSIYTDGTYPIGQTNACIIVPFVAEIDHSDYLLKTLQPVVWLVLIMELLVLCIIQCLHVNTLNLGDSILYGFGTLLMQPLAVREFRKRKPLLRFMHLLVIMTDVLINALFCASLTALLSTTIEGDQIESVSDFLRSGLPLMINQYEKEVYFDKKLFSEKLLKSLYVVKESVLEYHKSTLNTSYAYVVTAQEWHKLNFQQQLLRKPLFRFASEEQMCTANYFLRFPIQWNSPFQEIWQHYYLITSETGLNLFWEERSIGHAIKLNVLNKFTDEHANGIDFEFQYLSNAFVLHGCMLLLAMWCFLMELLIFEFKCWNVGGGVLK